MDATWVEKRLKEKNDLVEFQREYTVMEATELVCKAMREKSVNRTELAVRLGKSKGYISQLLDGETNMTLGTLSDVFTALDACLRLGYAPLSQKAQSDEAVDSAALVSWANSDCAWKNVDIRMHGDAVPLSSAFCMDALVFASAKSNVAVA